MSVRQISWKLSQKGVDPGLIEKAAEKAELTDHEQVIRALVEKRMRNRDEVTRRISGSWKPIWQGAASMEKRSGRS